MQGREEPFASKSPSASCPSCFISKQSWEQITDGTVLWWWHRALMKYSTIFLQCVRFLTAEDQKQARCGLGWMTASDETFFPSKKIPGADWALAVDLSGLRQCHYRMHLEDSGERDKLRKTKVNLRSDLCS